MLQFEIIPAKPWHCGQIARLIRREEHARMRAAGIDPHIEYRNAYSQTLRPKAWLINGRLAALFGVAGSGASPYGFLWLALSAHARKYPIAIVKEAKRQIAEAMITRVEIQTTILITDVDAVRLATALGFEFHGPVVAPHRFILATYSREKREAA